MGVSSLMMRDRIVCSVAVLAHLVVNVLHGRAHESLNVGLSTWQNIYVITVILIAPLIAMLLVWTRYARLGLVVLVISMAGSLIFGAIYHYVVVSPDHVSHLPPGDAQGLFRMTALLLILTELLGLVAGLLGLRSTTKVYS
jgi:hypothetical protein